MVRPTLAQHPNFLNKSIFSSEYSNVIRCSFKVTVNANWLPKRNCLDWFALEPRTAAAEVFNEIETGTHKVFNRLSGKFRSLVTEEKPSA